MAAPGNLLQKMALRAIFEHIVFTHTLISVRPPVASHLGAWKELVDECFKVMEKELRAWLAILVPAAKVVATDDELDQIVDILSNTLLAMTDNNRSADLYVFYFKGKRPSDLKRPVLGKQLEDMRPWVKALLASPDTTLQNIGKRLAAAIEAADAATSELSEAKSTNHAFRTLGERKQYVDRVNALRKKTYGEISQLPVDRPELSLPADYAEQFFKPVVQQVENDLDTLSSQELVALIAEKESDIADLRARLKDVVEAEDAEAKRNAERTAKAEELARLREEAQKQQARIKALEQALG
jgi:hypothetical protein